jgi:F-type H+-transporting ATPase subunit a
MSNLNFISNPLEQFEIRDLISIKAPILENLNLSITNISLYLIISFSIIILLNVMTQEKKELVHNN